MDKVSKNQVATEEYHSKIDQRIKNYEFDKPEQLVKMSVILKNHILTQRLFTNIQGKNYAHVTGWQFAGGLLGMLPRIIQVENLSEGKNYKWKADVEIISIKNNEVIGRGFSLCSSDENKKKSFDEYAILSMAQTRAIGKAYRNVIGWVMQLAGYESTPAEEMLKVDATTESPKIGPNEKSHECAVGKEAISKAEFEYSIKLYKKALCREHQPKSPKK